jgi:hypothetical protein
MKKIVMLFALLILAFPALASAGTLYGKFTNNYGRAVVCTVDMSRASEFQSTLARAGSNHTDQQAAATLLTFFMQSNDCYNAREDGNFSLSLPGGNSYTLFLTMAPDGSRVYWEVKNEAGEIDQIEVISVP